MCKIFILSLERIVYIFMNDRILLEEDEKIYSKLISKYPDKKVYGLTKSEYYYEISKQAKSKKMNTKQYLNFLGFTLDNKRVINYYSEDELIDNLCRILHNKEYKSIDYIKTNYPDEFDSIKYYTHINNLKRCDEYLDKKGFFKTGEKTNDLSKTFDSYSLSRLINDYDVKASQLASALHCTRQHISKIAKDISTINMNGWIRDYTDNEINIILKIINNKKYFYEDKTTNTTILICSNKLDFEKKAIVYIKNNIIKCMFSYNEKIEKVLKDNFFDILNETDFCLLEEVNNLWNEQGNKKINNNKLVEIDSRLHQKISNISAKKNMTANSFLKLFDYELKDRRIKNTEEEIIKIIKKYIIEDNIVKIRVKDTDYLRLRYYAYRNNFENGIEGLVNHYGFKYKGGKDNSDVIEKHITRIRENYIVKNNLIYICSYDPYYGTLNALAVKRDMNLQTLLKSWGFERIKNKKDLPKEYIPYDYTDDLKSKLLSNWTDESLKIVLEQLSNFNNEVYIDTNSYFYYIIFLQATLKNMEINKLINYLGYKRVFRKEKNTEQKLKNIESLLFENRTNYISDRIKQLKSIEAKYKEVTDTKLIIKRNKKLVKILKELYQGKCQLCGGNEPQIPIILKSNGDIYCEVHHIKSFSNIQSNNDDINEIDSYKNAIVLCPYHHKLVHFKNKGFKQLMFLDNDEVYLVGEDDERIKLNLNYHIAK